MATTRLVSLAAALLLVLTACAPAHPAPGTATAPPPATAQAPAAPATTPSPWLYPGDFAGRPPFPKILAYEDPSGTPSDAFLQPAIATGERAAELLRALQAGPEGSPAIPWRVGDWVQYAVYDEAAVPGWERYAAANSGLKPGTEPIRRPNVALATIAIVGSEEVEGRTCYWYQVEWQQDSFWIGVPPTEAKAERQGNWTALIRRDRAARIRLLVDGPGFERISAYRVKIDGEPEVGYTDQLGAALLPQVPLAEALILPALATQGEVVEVETALGTIQGVAVRRGDATTVYHPAVPVTGLAGYHLSTPYLQRRAVLLNYGSAAVAAPGKPEVALSIDTSLIIGTLVPRVVIAHDAAGAMATLGEVDWGRLDEVIKGGINWFEGDMSFVSKDGATRSQLARRFVAEMATRPAYFGVGPCDEVDLLDQFRSNALGGMGFLDEPSAYFGDPRCPSYDQACVSKDEAGTLTFPENYPRGPLTAAQAAEVYRAYVAGYGSYLGRYWHHRPWDCNYPPSRAQYDLAAGVGGYLWEAFGKMQRYDVHYLNRHYGAGLPEDGVTNLRLAASWMRGAARLYDGRWGVALYTGNEPQWADTLLSTTYSEGANLYLLWLFHEDSPIDDAEGLRLARALRAHAAQHPYQPAAAPSTAIVVPDGLHIPVGLFWEPGPGEAGKTIDEEYPYWNDFVVGIDPGPAMAALAREVKSLCHAGTPFDIVVNDAAWAASGSSPYRHTITIDDSGQVSVDRR
ncbi:MAG TPA: hypothetical protein PLJ35_01330 [Anaerolineae bacterium]|nr:hypothetical protein [Anaerolineae bacterium]HOQ97447.1 hypothetical protein [Anaerolineae bacterium]HPL27990.1 hypothetical protein [Anaerolineae bacterium]